MARSRRGRGEGGIFQRADGLWVASVSLRTSRRQSRRRKTVYGKSKSEVQTKLRKLQAETGQPADPERLTVEQFLTHWLENKVKPNKSPNTYRSYEMTVRLHVVPQLGGVRVDKLTVAQVQAAYGGMHRAGASARTREPRQRAVLHRAFKTAVRDKVMSFNPCNDVDRPTVDKGELKYLSPDQTLLLLDAAKPHRLYALFVLAVSTGMRQGELFGLDWSDIDLSGKAVNIRHSLEEIDGRHRIKEPKSRAGKAAASSYRPSPSRRCTSQPEGECSPEGHAKRPGVL